MSTLVTRGRQPTAEAPSVCRYWQTNVKSRIADERQVREGNQVMPAAPSLQQASLFVGKGFRHDAFAPCPLLSVKCMFNGSALYRADRAWFAVDETGYLILNDQQPYEIHIASPTRVESFIVFFPRSWAEQALDSLTAPQEKLLDEPESKRKQPDPHDAPLRAKNCGAG